MATQYLSHQDIQKRLADKDNLPSLISIGNREYTLIGDEPIGSGADSVVWAALDHLERKRVVKFRPLQSYKDTTPVSEAEHAVQLEDCDIFATFVDAEFVDVELLGQSYEMVCSVEHFVDGVTLYDYLRNEAAYISSSFLKTYVRALCTALRALQERGIRHNDLHPGNVIIANPALGDLSAERRIRVVDTGNVTGSGPLLRDDHISFVRHLALIWNTIHKRRDIGHRDRRFLEEVKPLLSQMLEEDQTIALRDPSQIAQQFDNAFDRSMAPPPEVANKLTSPFEYISADHIADDRLLVEIFANSCPWLEKVSGPDACLVTGPRGCGKSTIFRWLSHKAHLHKPVGEIESDLRIFGIYVSCNADLQNRLSWIDSESQAVKFRSLIIHYFNLIATREIVKTLAMIGRRAERETFWGFGGTVEKAVFDFIVQSMQKQSHGLLQGTSRIEHAEDLIQTEVFATQLAFRKNETSAASTSASFLSDFTSLLAARMPVLKKMPIAFLLDDYSTHRLREPVQRVLNQIIWQRCQTHVFKLSSEKHGAVLDDELKATSELTRERLEIDCGKEYLSLTSSNQTRNSAQFATDLLNNRLRAADYEGTAEVLIGRSQWPKGSLAKSLADKGQNPSPSDYHGLECISQLCSGDVASLLHVYSKIFEMGNVIKSTVNTVPRHTQDKAIVEVSRSLLSAVKTFHPLGQEMHKALQAFGNMVRRLLQEAKPQADGQPTQVPRIEIDESDGDAKMHLKEKELELAWELVRRAIFIEMEPGLSRHKNVTTLRWNVRRVYLAAFRASFSKNDAVKRTPDWLSSFLSDPVSACDQVIKEWGKPPREPPSHIQQNFEFKEDDDDTH